MSGTVWTEPGKGATASQIGCALYDSFENWNDAVYAADYHLDMIGGRYGLNRTNLALTGEPLTVEDLKRISEAK